MINYDFQQSGKNYQGPKNKVIRPINVGEFEYNN